MRAIRRFTASSSFYVGLLFSSMVLVGIFFVFYFVVLTNNDIFLRESEAAIDVKMQQLQQLEQLAGIDAVCCTFNRTASCNDQGYLFAYACDLGKVCCNTIFRFGRHRLK